MRPIADLVRSRVLCWTTQIECMDDEGYARQEAPSVSPHSPFFNPDVEDEDPS